MESVFYELNNIKMDINEMIEKWEKKHFSLLDEFNRTRGMMTEREICECVDHRKNVLRFVEDLSQVKNCYIPPVMPSVCDCCGGNGVVSVINGFMFKDCPKCKHTKP